MVTRHYYAHRLLVEAGQQELPPPSANEIRPRRSYANEANFDTNMVIILAALLCALICALGLNSIVRCALRCGRRMTFDASNGRSAAGTGLKKRALSRIPVAVYGAGVDMRGTDCPICLGAFMDGEKVRVLPECNHGFHVTCIDTWLASHSSCPTCRNSLLEWHYASSNAAPEMDASAASQLQLDSSNGQVGAVVVVDERS